MITWDVVLIGIGVLFAHLLILYFVTKKNKDIRGRHVVVTGKRFRHKSSFICFFFLNDKRNEAASIGKGQLII